MRVCAISDDGMADRLGVDAEGIAEKAADEVEIVDRMDRDFDARQAFEEGEQTPGRIDRQMRFDVDEPPEQAARERVLTASIIGAKRS